MKTQASKNILLTVLASLCSVAAFAQPNTKPSSIKNSAYVDFDAYEKLVTEVKQHRKTRLLSTLEFKKMSQEDKVVILDARSDSAFAAVHVKGAVHLNFSEFTQENLAKVIPSPEYKVLIYCNNNFNITRINTALLEEKVFARAMATKVARPIPALKYQEEKPVAMALNIPTYINLYGFGYANVYELEELVNTYDGIIEFEGTAVKKNNP